VEDLRRAVREQIGYGADLIKLYADWRNPTLTVEEMRVAVEEAHKAVRKVAAHATTPVPGELLFRVITGHVTLLRAKCPADAPLCSSSQCR
jgi:imidazolonepropionase-like amidohydrolase